MIGVRQLVGLSADIDFIDPSTLHLPHFTKSKLPNSFGLLALFIALKFIKQLLLQKIAKKFPGSLLRITKPSSHITSRCKTFLCLDLWRHDFVWTLVTKLCVYDALSRSGCSCCPDFVSSLVVLLLLEAVENV